MITSKVIISGRFWVFTEEVRLLQAGIQTDFLVRKVQPPTLGVALDELPKDTTSDALDQVRVIDKDAVVRFIVLDRGSARRMRHSRETPEFNHPGTPHRRWPTYLDPR